MGRLNFPVTIIQDNAKEGNETFSIRIEPGELSAPGDVQLLPPGSTTPVSQAVSYPVTITDDDFDRIKVNVIPDQAAIVGTAFSFQFAANAFESTISGTLTYSAKQYDGADLPSWLSFAAATHTFSGTPASGDAGRLRMKVDAAGPSGLRGYDVFDIVVSSKPSISGVARVGQTLTADTGGTGSFTYQWMRTDGSTDTNITNATMSTYTLVADDLDKKVKVKVTFTANSQTMELTSDAYPPHATIQAATSGAADIAGRRVVWEGTLTVGAESVGRFSEPIGHGWSSKTGELTERDAPIYLDSNTYRIGKFITLFAQVGDLEHLLGVPPGSLVFSLMGVQRPEKVRRSEAGADRGGEGGSEVARGRPSL